MCVYVQMGETGCSVTADQGSFVTHMPVDSLETSNQHTQQAVVMCFWAS